LSDFVLDASAVVAVVLREPGWEAVRAVLLESHIASINFGEVAQRFFKDGWPREEIEETLAALNMRVVVVDATLALDAAEMRETARAVGLSQADCICLALARRRGATAITADRDWLKIDGLLEVEVQQIR
jgi:ribonuclease VapC